MDDTLNNNYNKIGIISESDTRKDFEFLIDYTILNKPQFIRHDKGNVVIVNVNLLYELLEPYRFTANRFTEANGSITLALNELDLVVNAISENEALISLATDILEYAKDYYEDYHIWSSATNRKKHFPYVLKALILGEISIISEKIECQEHGIV